MRLLALGADGGFVLTNDLVDNIPQYAILSHTWGPDEQEVTFRDIQHHEGHHKQGYQKLKFCGEQAALDGLHYFWVDTCCIDKSNNTELSEAINSMFRWYKNAAQCYVYLPDVFKNVCKNGEASRASWESSFRKSRWFTRGWTLQELIAPKSVAFYSAEGQHLGDKASLETLLHEITGLPTDVLQGSPLFNFSTHSRFSWLGSRQTKRAEDRAYSLFGIFDVHLPLIYGEGEKNAFTRLKEEVKKRIQDCDQTFIPQSSGLCIKQGRSRFQSNITLSSNALSNQGNKITGLAQGDIEQEGSDFSGQLSAGDKSQILQGDQIDLIANTGERSTGRLVKA